MEENKTKLEEEVAEMEENKTKLEQKMEENKTKLEENEAEMEENKTKLGESQAKLKEKELILKKVEEAVICCVCLSVPRDTRIPVCLSVQTVTAPGEI